MKVLIAGGSSGGHIFPALSLAEELKARGEQVLLVLPEESRKNEIPLPETGLAYIPAARMEISGFFKALRSLFTLIKNAWQSFLFLLKFKPEAVVGFGTVNSLASVFFGWLFRAKTLIHEQNVVPGKANRFLARLVDKVAVSFEETEKYFGCSSAKFILSGNPIRKELVRLKRQEALDYFGFRQDALNILVIGGSQGSHKINLLIPQALKILPEKSGVQLIHIAGYADAAMLRDSYAGAQITAKVFTFLKDMQFAYSVADLAICRSGAMTLSELIFYRIPAILIPYPFAGGHQMKNAELLSAGKSAVIIKEADLSPQVLALCLKDVLAGERSRLDKMRSAYGKKEPLPCARILAEALLEGQ